MRRGGCVEAGLQARLQLAVAHVCDEERGPRAELDARVDGLRARVRRRTERDGEQHWQGRSHSLKVVSASQDSEVGSHACRFFHARYATVWPYSLWAAPAGRRLLRRNRLEQRVRAVHAAAQPLDAHVDVLVSTTPGIYRTEDGVSQVTVEKLAAGGIATVTLAIQAPTGPATPEGIATARAEVDAKLARIRELVAANPGRLGLARTAGDIERIHADGRIGVLIGFQNAYALGTDLALLDHYVEAGVRVFAFNHAGNNAFADSSRPAVPGDEPNGGLSALGRAAVRRSNDSASSSTYRS